MIDQSSILTFDINYVINNIFYMINKIIMIDGAIKEKNIVYAP